MNNFRFLSFGAGIKSRIFYKNGTQKFNFRYLQDNRSYIGETYEGTGKTIGIILNKKGAENLYIDYISKSGFKLSNGLKIKGPTAFFQNAMISWNVKSLNDISEESLELFTILWPKLDLLIIGYGIKDDLPFEKYKQIVNFCLKMKINFELCTTVDAAATFNFCIADKRNVAAALIPPSVVTINHGLSVRDLDLPKSMKLIDTEERQLIR